MNTTERFVRGFTVIFWLWFGVVAGRQLEAQGPVCSANPPLATTCFANGDPLPMGSAAGAIDSLVEFDYNGTSKTLLATASQTGSVWGLAYDVANDRLFSSAVVRRHTGLGPSGAANGLGAIYVSSPPSAAPIFFHDVAAHVSVGAIGTNVARGLSPMPDQPSHDAAAFSLVGKAGLGDIDLSADGGTLYVTNLLDGRVYAVDTASPGSAPTALPAFPAAGCVNGVARPWALKVDGSTLFAGLVCTAEMPAGTAADLSAHVYSFDGLTWTSVLSLPLDFTRQDAYPGFSADWNPWRDSVSDINAATPAGELFFSHPSPILSDLEILDDGSLVLGFTDRTAMQFGARNYGTDGSNTMTFYYTVSGGDILRASAGGGGTFTLESDALVGGIGPTGGAGTNSGPGGGEFYFEESFLAPGEEHRETSFGGLAFLPGASEVVLSAMDPEAFDSGGIYWLNNADGTKVRVQELYAGANNGNGFFGKAVGLGDVELLCGDPPVMSSPTITASKTDAILVDGDMDGRLDAGETLTYTVVINNSDTPDGLLVMFNSSVDANTTLVVGSVATSQGTVTSGNTAGDTAVAVDLGTLAGSGGSVTITFDVTVNTPIPAGVSQISCQGTVTGSNLTSTPTDDPDDPMSSTDPTLTPLDLGEDFGDAPDSYTTTASPSHTLDSTAGIYLGACVDSELSGQPAAMFGDPADGDDVNDLGTPITTLGTCVAGDEDGLTFDTMIVACSTTNQLTVTSAGSGRLDGWIDFNGDGDFADSGEQIFTSEALSGSDALMYTAPCSTASGTTYSRFRVSSTGGLSFDGAAPNGEVEDYQVTVKGLDLGDAPDSYDTTDPATAASHVVDPGSTVYLGTCVDTEAMGQAAAVFGDPADGDDANDLG
ncbi:MAG: GEVED domain-containing protein, partial [Acidobacteriota bacterium]